MGQSRQGAAGSQVWGRLCQDWAGSLAHLCHSSASTMLGHALAQGTQHKGRGLASAVLPCPGHGAWGWGPFCVRLSVTPSQAGSRNQCPVWRAVQEDAAARRVRASGQGWGAATGSAGGRARANALHHHADEASPGLCQAPWAVGTRRLSPPCSTKSGTPQGGGAARDKPVSPPFRAAWGFAPPCMTRRVLPAAGQAPSLGAGAAAQSAPGGCGSPLALVWLSGKHMGHPSTSPCPQWV